MNRLLNVGIIGNWDPSLVSHRATEEALHHAAAARGVTGEYSWWPTRSLEHRSESGLESFDALWCAPGSPYRSMEGALAAIRYAREADRPFIGT